MGLQTILYTLLVLTLAVLLANGHIGSRRRRVNCRVFIYAPRCRGVAAKRAVQHITSNVDDVISSQRRADLEDAIIKTALSERGPELDEERRVPPETILDSLLHGILDDAASSSSSSLSSSSSSSSSDSREWHPLKRPRKESLLSFILTSRPHASQSEA